MTETDPTSATAVQEAPTAEPQGPTFDALPLTAEVQKALAEMGYQRPTPVQLACWEPCTRGRDVIVQARTGTGKTTAFGLPLVDQIVRKSGGLQALILTPTRELALQVAAEVAKLGKHRGLKVAAVYGGAPMGRQIAELEEGAQIVAGTPGRVLDHLRRGTMDPSTLRTLVLDEADEMLSMGFEKELNAIVEKLPKGKQTMLFSATVGNEVGRLVREMKEPETILLSGDQVGALSLTHYVYVQRGDKTRELLRILDVENPTSAILFCNTKDETERVARELGKAGYDAGYLSGDLEQREREKVLAKTREGKLRFLVATDVAARGIDISHLTHVINVDFPDSPAQYVHRTGRTGRAGRTGTAISLIAPKDVGNLYYLRLTYGLRPIERTLPTEDELAARRQQDLVDRVATAMHERRPDREARALARRLLSHDEAESLVATLLTQYLGSLLVARDEAQKARRAKNPPAEAAEAAAAAETKSEVAAPSTESSAAVVDAGASGERRGRDRGARRERPARDEKKPRVIDRLAEWSPPEEADDESPILSRAERAAAEAAQSTGAEASGATLFVNVGRRDGVRAGDLVRMLTDAGVPTDGVGRVRLRDKHTFVDLLPEFAARAIEIYKAQSWSGRAMNAEPARPRDEAPVEASAAQRGEGGPAPSGERA
jgi:ATP-dependent RNA helicase DeaD